MSGKTTPAAGKDGGELTAEEVATYLRRHPDFLGDHTELLEILTPPSERTGANVHDMQQFMARRLGDEVTRLRGQLGELIDTGRANMTVQSQVHGAVLALLEARSFEHLIYLLTEELAPILDVDAVTICVERVGDEAPNRARTAGVYVLEPHGVDSRIGQGHDVLLANDIPADPDVFGPAAGIVRSQALARLRCGKRAPSGLIAFGARDRNKFQPEQGADLLVFLARALERQIQGWLNLPS